MDPSDNPRKQTLRDKLLRDAHLRRRKAELDQVAESGANFSADRYRELAKTLEEKDTSLPRPLFRRGRVWRSE